MSNLAKIKKGSLDEIITTQGLAIEDGEQIKQSYQPFIEQLAIIHEEAKKINFENPTALDEKIARELRLRTVKVRTGSSERKDDRKRIHLLKANVEQDSYKLIESSCKLTEEVFLQVEKAREIAEKKAKEARKATREATLTELGFDYTYTDLLNMPDIQFDELVLKIENEISAKKEADRLAKLEEERLENVKKLKEERTTIAMPYYQFWSEFEKSLNFGEVSEGDFNAFIERCKNAKAKFDEDQEKIRLENERLQKEAKEREEQLAKEREERERQLAKERKEAEEKRIEADKIARAERELIEEKARKEREELQEKNRIVEELARKEREKQAEILKKEREERERIERDIAAKKQEDARIAKANELAKKKAAAAPDKDKLTALVKLIEDIEMPIMDTDEANSILESVDQLLGKVCTFIEQKRDQL